MRTSMIDQVGGHRDRRVVALVYTAALFMSTIDVTIVNVALPAIGRDLHVPAAGLASVSTSYLVAIAVVLSAAAWLRARFGGRAALLTAIAVFTLASAACAAAWSLPALVAARALQGVGGGLLAPIGLGMLYEAYPPADRVRVTATTALVGGLAPILGPTLGGLLVSASSWRAVFLVNLPIGVAAVVLGLVLLPPERGTRASPRFDLVGFLLAATGLPLLVLGLSLGADDAWSSAGPPTALAAGCVLIAAFAVHTLRRHEAPLLRLRLLRGRSFAVGMGVVLLSNAAFFGGLYVIALHLQQDLRLSPSAAGAAMLLEAVPVALGAQLTSRVLLRRFRTDQVAAVGLAGTAVALTAMALVPARPAAFLPLLIVLGCSWSLVFIPVTIGANAQITGDDTTHAATLLTSFRQVASAVGIALGASLLGLAGAGAHDLPAFLALAALAAAATAVMLLARPRHA